ncbi:MULTISPECIES: hypothetical protein [unclassified Luteococcus]|uniref:hypothetical protein n=1 Tax=unclassified Luteococcus TaxID=2639923 RepID=UPI00313B1D7D
MSEPPQTLPLPQRVPLPRHLVLHRFTVKPRHLDPYLEIWRRELALRSEYGFTSHRAFVETDAEPKLTWLYSHDDDPADAQTALALDPRWGALSAERAPHVFRNDLVRPVEPELLTRATAESLRGCNRPERIAIMRRYSIVGGWDDFLQIWRQIVPVREKYGFRCLFAVADRPKDMFTWAFDFDGDWADFPAAQRGYYRDPARVELRKVFDHMADYCLHPARQLLL